MDLPAIDWSMLGSFAGGAATAVLTRFLGIAQKVAAMERRIDLQAENHASLSSELALTRERLARTDAELQRVTRLLLAERRDKRALAERVTELEAQLKHEREQLVRLRFEYAESLGLKERSTKTLPPPGGRPR